MQPHKINPENLPLSQLIRLGLWELARPDKEFVPIMSEWVTMREDGTCLACMAGGIAVSLGLVQQQMNKAYTSNDAYKQYAPKLDSVWMQDLDAARHLWLQDVADVPKPITEKYKEIRLNEAPVGGLYSDEVYQQLADDLEAVGL